MPKTLKKVAKSVVKKKKVLPKKKSPAIKTPNQLSKEKFLLFLGLLIIITGASIMLEILGLSFKASASNYLKDFFLFPIAIVFLLLGIGIVANHSFHSKH